MKNIMSCDCKNFKHDLVEWKKYLVNPKKYLYLLLSSVGGSEQAEDDGEHDEAVEESEETDHEENLEEWGKDVRSGGDQQGQGQHGRAAAWIEEKTTLKNRNNNNHTRAVNGFSWSFTVQSSCLQRS